MGTEAEVGRRGRLARRRARPAADALRLELPGTGRAGQPARDGDAARALRRSRSAGRTTRSAPVDARSRRSRSGRAALEKHVTLDRTRPGPDHAASADADGFADYVRPGAGGARRARRRRQRPGRRRGATPRHWSAAAGTPPATSPSATQLGRRGRRGCCARRPASRRAGGRPGPPRRPRRVRRGRAVAATHDLADRAAPGDQPRSPSSAATRADLFPLAAGAARSGRRAGPRRDAARVRHHRPTRDYGDPLADAGPGRRHGRAAGRWPRSAERRPAHDRRRRRIARGHGRRLVQRLRPDVFVVLGDRWELLYAVPPVVLLGRPGRAPARRRGDRGRGRRPDAPRDQQARRPALRQHGERAAARVRQLGEPADRVVVTGRAVARPAGRRVAPASRRAARGSCSAAQPVRPFALVTYHPATAGGPDPATGARSVLAAVRGDGPASALVTHPGWTAGREAVLAEIARGGRAARDVRRGGRARRATTCRCSRRPTSSSATARAASSRPPSLRRTGGQRRRPPARPGRAAAMSSHVAEDRDAIAAAIRARSTPHFRAAAPRGRSTATATARRRPDRRGRPSWPSQRRIWRASRSSTAGRAWRRDDDGDRRSGCSAPAARPARRVDLIRAIAPRPPRRAGLRPSSRWWARPRRRSWPAARAPSRSGSASRGCGPTC